MRTERLSGQPESFSSRHGAAVRRAGRGLTLALILYCCAQPSARAQGGTGTQENKPGVSSKKKEPQEDVPAKLAERRDRLRAQLVKLGKPDDSAFQGFQAKVAALSEALQSASCPRAAARLLQTWGDVCRERVFRPGAALKAYADAESLFRRLGAEGRLASIALERGVVYDSLSRYEEALGAYRRALDLVEGLLSRQVEGLGSAGARGFRAAWRRLPVALLNTVRAMGKTNPGKASPAAALAFRALDVMEGRTILEVMSGGGDDAVLTGLAGKDREEHGRLRGKRRELLKRREEISREKGKERAKGLRLIREQLQGLDREERQFAEGLRLRNPLATRAAYPRAASPEEVREALPKGVALVELALEGEGAWGFLLTKNTFALLDLGPGVQIRDDLGALRGDLAGGARFLDVERLSRLSKNVLGPVLQALKADVAKGPKTLLFSLKGELARLPMEVLLTEDPAPKAGGRGLPYLVTTFDVGYVPSASTYVAMRKQAALRKESRGEEKCLGFFGVGMPLDVVAEAEEEGGDLGDVKPLDLDPVLGRSGKNRALLYGSADEVLALAGLFGDEEERGRLASLDERIQDEELAETARVSGIKGKRFKVLLRGGAHEKAFKTDADLGRARFVHFAGHGEADLSSPSLSRLVFAQAPGLKENTGDDGFLYFRELAGLSLHADLLALSACSTNDGVLFPTEGIMGLAQAGLMAGAESVLSTLWRVNDEAASRLMVHFYEQLLGSETSRLHALAETKRWALGKGLPLSTWSAYILWDAALER